MYKVGLGVEKNITKAIKYFKKCSKRRKCKCSIPFRGALSDGNGVNQIINKLKNGLKKQPSKDMLGLTI